MDYQNTKLDYAICIPESEIPTYERASIMSDESIMNMVAKVKDLIEVDEERKIRKVWSKYHSNNKDKKQHCCDELAGLLKEHPQFKGKKIVNYKPNKEGSTSIGIIDIEEDYMDENGKKSKKIVQHYIKSSWFPEADSLLDNLLEYNDSSREDSIRLYDDIIKLFNESPCCYYPQETKDSIIRNATSRQAVDALSLYIFQNVQKTRVKTSELTLHYDPERRSYFTLSRDLAASIKPDKETSIILLPHNNDSYIEHTIDKESEIMVSMYYDVYGLNGLFDNHTGVKVTRKEGSPCKSNAVILDHGTEYKLSEIPMKLMQGWGQWIVDRTNSYNYGWNMSHPDEIPRPYLPERLLFPDESALATGSATTLDKGSDEFKALQEFEYLFFETVSSKKMLKRHEPTHPLANKDGNVNFAEYLYDSIINLKQSVTFLYEKYGYSGATPWVDVFENVDHIKDIVLSNMIYRIELLLEVLPRTTLSRKDKNKFEKELSLDLKELKKETKAMGAMIINWEKLEKDFYEPLSSRQDKHEKTPAVGATAPKLKARGRAVYNVNNFKEKYVLKEKTQGYSDTGEIKKTPRYKKGQSLLMEVREKKLVKQTIKEKAVDKKVSKAESKYIVGEINKSGIASFEEATQTSYISNKYQPLKKPVKIISSVNSDLPSYNDNFSHKASKASKAVSQGKPFCDLLGPTPIQPKKIVEKPTVGLPKAKNDLSELEKTIVKKAPFSNLLPILPSISKRNKKEKEDKQALLS